MAVGVIEAAVGVMAGIIATETTTAFLFSDRLKPVRKRVDIFYKYIIFV
jgi:hypothetical protein